jgi:capsular polysaccharide biosynthesis protein
MLSAAVLDPIATNLGYTPKLDQDAARDKLKSQIKSSFNAKDKLLTLTTQADTPQAAQARAKAVLQQTYAQSQPRDTEKLRLQKQLAQAQAREKEATQTAQLLGRKMEGGGTTDASEVAQGYAQMIGVVKESQAIQIDIERQLQGLDASALVQEATLPTKHAAPKRGLVTIMATLAAGFALLLFVFIRQALRNASQDAESAEKLSAIQTAWRKALGKSQ